MKRLLMASAMAAATCGSAHAGYYVAAIAGAGSNGLNVDSTYGYNFDFNPVNIDTTVGAGSIQNTYGCGAPNSCTLGGSVTPNTLATNATGVSVDASMNWHGAAEFGVAPYYVTAGATAHANLASASVGFAGSGSVEPYNNANGGIGSGQAVAVDTLHFAIAGATPSTVTTIGIVFRTDGTAGPSAAVGGGQIGIGSEFLFNGSFLRVDISQGNGGDAPLTSMIDSPSGLGSGWETAGVEAGSTPTDYTMTAEYQITGASATIPIELYMSGSCGAGSSCDYSHTGAVSFDLPTGVSFTSDSGVFMTASAVPEPESLAVLAAAIGMLAVTRRRRQIAT